MDQAIYTLVQSVHDAPPKIMLVTAGAGTQALQWILGVAGASRTLLEALVPYSRRSFCDFLGQEPEKHVVAGTGRLLAGRALTRAQQLREEAEPLVGLACTATIATDRPKRGAHRAYVATWQKERLVSYELRLEKGARDRLGEEDLVSRLMLNGLAAAYGLDDLRLSLLLGQGDRLTINTVDFAVQGQRLHDGEIDFFGVHADGRLRFDGVQPRVLLPGAFNPLHRGHLGLARVVEEMLDRPVAFELSAHNVDKPPLPVPLLLERMSQFAGRWPIFLTNAPTFLEKTRLFPDCTFVVGYDTARRIVAPRYYDDSEEKMMAALAEIRERGGQFLVAGRVDEEAGGDFSTIEALSLPAGVADLFAPIPPERFRIDISSTELRRAGRRGRIKKGTRIFRAPCATLKPRRITPVPGAAAPPAAPPGRPGRQSRPARRPNRRCRCRPAPEWPPERPSRRPPEWRDSRE
jgi:hypothetical protein